MIVVIDARAPTRSANTYAIPAAGLHGLELDSVRQRLFCACDARQLVRLESQAGRVLAELELSGAPDVIMLNARYGHLYVAIGDPGVIDVIETAAMRRLETIETEQGAYTLACDAARTNVYAFLPQTHRAAVYVDKG